MSDYPRRVANCLRPCGFSAFYAFPVSLALPVPFLLARRRLPISLLRLPARPSPRRLPAICAAITLARLPGMEALLAPFQQTRACPRPAHSPLPPLATSLLLDRLGTIFGRAHGR